MAISPFSARPASPEGERRRARLALVLAAIGIAAILIVYALAPGVRHAVNHAAHSVKHAVGNVFDHDHHGTAVHHSSALHHSSAVHHSSALHHGTVLHHGSDHHQQATRPPATSH
ncbi:MAG TPA: hypothetical protein VMD79_10345 [Solirubrobacteraceae bacterium]|nr:hypothetical protein [Solirubrobacteraceae bacterium]